MSLADLIRKRTTTLPATGVATATVATPATQEGESAATVAIVASVAVANPRDKQQTKPTVATVATVAVASPKDEQSGYTNEQEPSYHGFTMADLQAEAHPDEWIQICDNPEALEAFALALLEDRQIKAGIKPERFTRIVHCPQCGAVPMPPTWPTSGRHDVTTMPTTRSCRWCENRRAGKRYPRAYPLPPNGYSRKQDEPWPWSEDCRPLAWQGADERKGNS